MIPLEAISNLTPVVCYKVGALRDLSEIPGIFQVKFNEIDTFVDSILDDSVDEDQPYIIDITASDIDGNQITLTAQVDGNGSASVDGTTLTVTPSQDYNGNILVTVTASDNESSGQTSFTLTVKPVNDAPVVESFIDNSINEEERLELGL